MHCSGCKARTTIYTYTGGDTTFSYCKLCMMKRVYDLVLTDTDYAEITLEEIRQTLKCGLHEYITETPTTV